MPDGGSRWPPPGLLALLAAAVLVWGSTLRHEWLWSHLFDLGIFDQTVYLLSRGSAPVSTVLGFHILGDHAAFILYPVALLYRLYPSVVWLFAIQAAALAAGAIPLYRLARRAGLSEAWSRAVGACYLLYPAVFNVAMYDFHPETLAVPALLWGAHWGLAGRPLAALACLVVAMSCKEVLGLTVAGMGLWLFLNGRRALGALAFGSGLAWFAVATLAIIPAFSGRPPSAINRYAALGGEGIDGLVWGALTHPQEVLGAFVAPELLAFVGMLAAPVLPALALRAWPALLPAVPMLVLNALSSSPYQRDLLHQYTVPIFPFLFVWLIQSLAAWQAQSARRWLTPGRLALWAVVGFLALAKYGYFFSLYRSELGYRAAARAAIATVPPDASVMAASNLCGHLAHREAIVETPGSPDLAEVVAAARRYEWVVLDPFPLGLASGTPLASAAVEMLLEDGYERVFDRDGVVALRRIALADRTPDPEPR